MTVQEKEQEATSAGQELACVTSADILLARASQVARAKGYRGTPCTAKLRGIKSTETERDEECNATYQWTKRLENIHLINGEERK